MSEDCDVCLGTGLGRSDSQRCRYCGGSGTIKTQVDDGGDDDKYDYSARDYDRAADDYFSR